MNAQHTPGPWNAVKYTNKGQFVTETKITSKDGSVLAMMGPCNIDANARLITAAPEMLEACKFALQQLKGFIPKGSTFLASSLTADIAILKNAIAKATGETK